MIIKTKCIYCGKEDKTEIVDITDWYPYICNGCLKKIAEVLKENTCES